MPFSQSSQISTILTYIEKLKPLSILDVGTGMGQYGFLIRTNLENINLFKIEGKNAQQQDKKNWKIQIDGIEGCGLYMTPVHDYSYNRMLIGEAITILKTIKDNSYELVIAIDILEHFSKEDGYIFLDELKRVSSQNVLISTPKTFIPQEIEANPYENHRSLWEEEELKNNQFYTILLNQKSWIAIYSNE
jgi:2-polyprenyl-3-methyl-5-hydroxy-6-metoxy-1,4-benzoquinol methylase